MYQALVHLGALPVYAAAPPSHPPPDLALHLALTAALAQSSVASLQVIARPQPRRHGLTVL